MDINCIKCGEPWNAYGARHGDMAPWEYQLFRKGAGCPGCEGRDNGFQPTQFSDVEFGDEDPIVRIHQFEDKLDNKLPKWERPENPVFWSCETCGVQVIGDLDYPEDDDEYLQYNLPYGAPGHQWYHSHPYYRGTAEKTPAHTFKHESYQWIYITSERSGGGILSYEKITTKTHVCEFCLEHCHECGKPVCSLLEVDTYDVGYAACPSEYASMRCDVFCADCLDKMCSECGGLPDDCECIDCKECHTHLATCNFDLPEVCPSCGHSCKSDE